MSFYPVQAKRLSIGAKFRLSHKRSEVCRVTAFDSIHRIFIAVDATGLPFQLKPKTLVLAHNHSV